MISLLSKFSNPSFFQKCIHVLFRLHGFCTKLYFVFIFILIIALFSRIGLWVHKTIIKPVINIMINNNYKDTSGMVYTFSRRQHVGIRNLNRCLKYRNKQNHDTITYSRGRYKYEESIFYKNWEMLLIIRRFIYNKQFKMSILIYKLDYFFRFNQFGYMFIICTIENNRKNMRHGSLIYCLQNLFPVVFRKLICNPLFLYCVCMLIYLRFQPEIWHKVLI